MVRKVPLQNDLLGCASCSILNSPSVFCAELIIRQTEGGWDWMCLLVSLKGCQLSFMGTTFCSLLLNPFYLGGKMHNTVPFHFPRRSFPSSNDRAKSSDWKSLKAKSICTNSGFLQLPLQSKFSSSASKPLKRFIKFLKAGTPRLYTERRTEMELSEGSKRPAQTQEDGVESWKSA